MSPFGELPDGWSWSTLYECCQGIFDCPHSTPQLTDDGPYVVRTQDILTGVFRVEQAGHVSYKTYEERVARAVPSYGDLLYSREGTYFGIAAEVPKDTLVCLGQRMVLIRPDERLLDFRYLRYWLNSPMMSAYIHGFRDGSVAERLNLPTIRGLPIAIPSLPEQRAIAHALGTLDDKIELNRQIDQTLEQIAAALFKSWFVDFDPVRAKAAGRQPEGMDAEMAAFFPDRLVASEIGEIPDGWVVGKLEDIARPVRTSVNPSENPGELFSLYSLPAFDTGRMPQVESGAAIKSNKSLLPDNCVLISKLNPHIPRVWLPFDSNGLRRIASTEFVVVEPLNHSYLPFLFALVSSSEFNQSMQGMVTGTTGSHQRVPPASILSMPLALPPTDLIDAYSVLMRPIYQRVHANLGETATLALLRDTLLPRLLSGELRVPTDLLDEEAVPMQPLSEELPAQSRF